MTNAHELAERWFDNLTDKYIGSSPPTETVNSLALLIHQVAERTREECYHATLKKMEVTKYTGWKPLDDCLLAIRNARWEDENAL